MIDHFKKYIKKEHHSSTFHTIKFRTNFTNCIHEAMKKRGYKQTDGDDWDIFWSEKDNIQDLYQGRRLLPQQKLNHFKNYFELCRKDSLVRNLKKHKKVLEREGKSEESGKYNFFPLTFVLPSEYVIFADEFKKSQGQQKNIWIMKPVCRSQGKGIFLFNKMSNVSAWQSHNAEQYIAQKYVSDPLLIGGKKFDLRIYVLVLSYNPLTIYLNRSGFARFTHYRYEQNKISDASIHLTNVAVQKQTDNYDENLGGKWTIQKLKLYLMSKYQIQKVNFCFYKIQQVIIKTLESVQKVMSAERSQSFQLYGFDVLLDSKLSPWLIEVNGSPSMTANTPFDHQMKMGILDDTLSIVDLDKIFKEPQQQVGGFDLIYKGHPIKSPIPNTSFLGTYNNRQQNIRKLAKIHGARINKQMEQRKTQQVKKPMSNISNIKRPMTNVRKLPKKDFIIKSKINTAKGHNHTNNNAHTQHKSQNAV